MYYSQSPYIWGVKVLSNTQSNILSHLRSAEFMRITNVWHQKRVFSDVKDVFACSLRFFSKKQTNCEIWRYLKLCKWERKVFLAKSLSIAPEFLQNFNFPAGLLRNWKTSTSLYNFLSKSNFTYTWINVSCSVFHNNIEFIDNKEYIAKWIVKIWSVGNSELCRPRELSLQIVNINKTFIFFSSVSQDLQVIMSSTENEFYIWIVKHSNIDSN